MRHLAVVQDRYIDLALAGRKTVESRLMRTRRAPFGRVSAGDVVLLKPPGGVVRASAVVAKVWEFGDLTPGAVGLLRRQFEQRVLAGREYWRLRRDASFACFIELSAVRAETEAFAVPRLFGAAWVCLDVDASRMTA